MDKYIEADRQLTSLLWPDRPEDAHHRIASTNRWSRDNTAALRLQAEYQVDIHWYGTLIYAKAYQCAVSVMVILHEHPDAATALRYAIVKAVTERLMREKLFSSMSGENHEV